MGCGICVRGFKTGAVKLGKESVAAGAGVDVRDEALPRGGRADWRLECCQADQDSADIRVEESPAHGGESMKKLITSGLIVALGWLVNGADAQEIQWRASTAKNPNPNIVAPVNVGVPMPVDSSVAPTAGIRPFASGTTVIRAQAPDEKTVPAIPKLEVAPGADQKPAKPLPKDPQFSPPPPTAVTPSPIFGSLGMNEDGFCGDWCGDGLCGGRRFGGFGDCNDRARFWGGAEYLMWWQKGQSVPPLVTSSPAGQVGAVGALGDPRTTILYQDIPNPTRGGGRFHAGMWLRHFCNVGFEASYFFLNRTNSSSVFVSDGDPQLARPFRDAELGVQDAEIFTPGSAVIQTFSQLWGLEGNFRHKLRCGPCGWCDLIWGYRHLNLSEGINIAEDQSLPIPGFAPLRILEQESFRTRNTFNGVQMGLTGERRLGGRCFVGWTTKVALGNSHSILNIEGNTTFFAPAPIGTVTQQGALLATPTNIGRYTSNRFAVVPEVGLKVGVDITDHLRIFAGYDFLYWSSVMRPGEQIDLNVAPSFRPTIFGPGAGGGPRVPQVLYRATDYWAQGFSFGLQYRY